jgi:hypothetical protein
MMPQQQAQPYRADSRPHPDQKQGYYKKPKSWLNDIFD